MADSNLYCDELACSNSAQVFGFLPGGTKKKVCQDHMLTLVNKQVSIFSIAAFQFMETAKDGAAYEERKELMQRGLGAVMTLESRCEEAWSQGQTRLQTHCTALNETIQKTYQGMWDQGSQKYEETKEQLATTRKRLEGLVRSKHLQLSPEDLELCEAVPAGAPFRLVVGDCRVAVVETLQGHFHLISADKQHLQELVKEQQAQGKVDIAQEVSQYAREWDYALGDFAEEARKLVEQATQQLKHLLTNVEVEKRCLSTGLQSIKTGEYAQALEQLEQGRSLLRQKDLQTSELWLQLSNSLAEALHQVGRYQEGVRVCEQVLATWGGHSHTFELWRAVFFLSECLYFHRQYNQGYAVVEKWTGKLKRDSPPCQCVWLCTQASMLYRKNLTNEAVSKLEAGLKLAQQLIPNTYLTAYCRHYLGVLYSILSKPREEEEQFVKVLRVYAAVCPFSIFACVCLNRLGGTYYNTQRYSSAEEKLQQSYLILSTRYPDTPPFAICLYSLGLVYEKKSRREEARQKLETALPLLRKFSSSLVKSCEKTLKKLSSK